MAISNPSLKALLQQLWKTPSERLGLLRQTEPYKICYIGSDCGSEHWETALFIRQATRWGSRLRVRQTA